MLSKEERTIITSRRIAEDIGRIADGQKIDYSYVDCDYKYTGREVLNKKSNKVGIVLRENPEGSIQVLESINPKVICTHDNWNTLTLLEG